MLAAAAPPTPPIAPYLPDVSALDRDGDRVDDRYDAEPGPPEERVVVEAIFKAPIGGAELDAFRATGGVVRHVFRAVSYGFTGTLARKDLRRAAKAAGGDLLLLKADRKVELHLDEATRTGRVRPIWAAGFAGSPSGFSGGSNVTIGVLDTGIDGTHPDLAGRMAGWKDYTIDAEPTPIDPRGHGTHVASIALGSGAAFGIGPGTLAYTEQNDISGYATGTFNSSPVHLSGSFTLTSTATWLSGGSTDLSLFREDDDSFQDGIAIAGPTTGPSPLSLSFSGTAAPGAHYMLALFQNAAKQIGTFAISTRVTGYPAVGDGFPAMRGVAAEAKWYGARVFRTTGQGATSDIAEAMDDMVAQRRTLGIKVVNMSFSIGSGGIDVTQRTKANTMVANGIVVVASNGNNGPSAETGDPGRAANAITVGATNDANVLTEYTSGGSSRGDADEDDKPDLLAPGGSQYRSKILAADSNTKDAEGLLPDATPNDYANVMGTSMAAPFVAGSAALLIEALERSGVPWSFDDKTSPFLVKSLLLESATEVNAKRERSTTGHPILGRSASLRDSYEGYGLINPDAAIEAATIPFEDFFTATTTGTPTDRRAWGRRVEVEAGRTLRFSLTAPVTGDYDLYLYDRRPGSNGRPILVAAADRAGEGKDETLTYTAKSAMTLHLFVKRISGQGPFLVRRWIYTCGDGALEPGEECDEGGAKGSGCCSPTCQLVDDGTTCNDESVCTKSDTCHAGVCSGVPSIVCPTPDECHVGLCAPATGACGIGPAKDGTPCHDGACQGGTCLRIDAGKPSGLDDDVSLIPDSAGLTAYGGGCACRTRPSGRDGAKAIALVIVASVALRRRRRACETRRAGRRSSA